MVRGRLGLVGLLVACAALLPAITQAATVPTFKSVKAAEAKAHFRIVAPTWLPRGIALESVSVDLGAPGMRHRWVTLNYGPKGSSHVSLEVQEAYEKPGIGVSGKTSPMIAGGYKVRYQKAFGVTTLAWMAVPYRYLVDSMKGGPSLAALKHVAVSVIRAQGHKA